MATRAERRPSTRGGQRHASIEGTVTEDPRYDSSGSWIRTYSIRSKVDLEGGFTKGPDVKGGRTIRSAWRTHCAEKSRSQGGHPTDVNERQNRENKNVDASLAQARRGRGVRLRRFEGRTAAAKGRRSGTRYSSSSFLPFLSFFPPFPRRFDSDSCSSLTCRCPFRMTASDFCCSATNLSNSGACAAPFGSVMWRM